MNPLNQVNIQEKTTIYDVSLAYHSELKNDNYEVKLKGEQEPDGLISLTPDNNINFDNGFVFSHSDPDRVIAIAQMMMSFAQMVKNENRESDGQTKGAK